MLDDVPHALPALARAEKLTKRAASVQFDWPDWRQTLAKVQEELGEVREAADADDKAKLHEELGDLLFATANLARKLGVDAEAALRDANLKFNRRFHYVEAARRRGRGTAGRGRARAARWLLERDPGTGPLRRRLSPRCGPRTARRRRACAGLDAHLVNLPFSSGSSLPMISACP